MNKFSAFTLSVMGMVASMANASDFTVLTTPEEVYNNSTEDVEGAKATFLAVLDNADATDAEKLAAMQAYQQSATPKAGYAFDMTYLLSCTAATGTTPSYTVTQPKLAEAWKTDIEGLTFGADDVLMAYYHKTRNETYIRVDTQNSGLLKEASDCFALYQNVTLSKGEYHLQSQAFVSGLAKAANLAAGTNLSDPITGAPLKDYSVNFKMTSTEEIKIGYWRNATAGNLTQIGFNNLELYKLSGVVVMAEDATDGLTPATDVNVQLNRTFNAGEYTPICLPFAVANWREVFEDCMALSRYADNELVFANITGENTQARKPYLVKMKNDVTADNYLVFNGIEVTKGNPGAWLRDVAEGAEEPPYFMVGNWAAGVVPENCYYFSENGWKLSDGTAPLTAFSAYIDGSRVAAADETLPAVIAINTGNGSSSIISNFASVDADATVNVYNLQGIMVKHGANAADATAGLPAGLYIVNGKKIVKY